MWCLFFLLAIQNENRLSVNKDLEISTPSCISAVFVPQGGIVTGGGTRIRRFNGRTAKEEFSLESPDFLIQDLAFSAQAEVLVSVANRPQKGKSDGEIGIWDLKKQKLVKNIKVDDSVLFAVAANASGEECWIAGNGSLKDKEKEAFLVLLNLKTLKTTRVPLSGFFAYSLAISQDGSVVAVGGRDSQKKAGVLLVDNEGKRLRYLPSEDEAIKSVTFSKEGGFIAMGSEHGFIEVVALKQNADSWRFAAHKGSVSRLAFFSEDMLISVSADSRLKAWNLKSKKNVISTRAHDEEIWSLSFSPEDGKLLTCGNDRKIIVWRLDRNE